MKGHRPHFTLGIVAATLALMAPLVVSLPPAAYAADNVVVPVGDWIGQASGAIASIAVAVLSWIAAKWLPAWVRTYLTEQLLSRAVDYGIAAVAGAAKGKVLEIPVANAVLREAAIYAVDHAPTTAKWLGDTLTPKLIARLSAAGVLPAEVSATSLVPS